MDKDFFSMTRRERRGTIVVLVIILVLLGASWAWKHTSRFPSETMKSVTEMQVFEAQADSFQSALSQPKKPRKTEEKKRDSRHKKQPRRSQPKSPPPERRMDPVPQF